jgi:hypothetical protein
MAPRSGKVPTTSVRRLISLFRAFLEVVGPDLLPHVPGEGGEGEEVFAGGFEVLGGLGVLLVQPGDGGGHLLADGGCVGLFEDGPQQVVTHGWADLGTWDSRGVVKP